MISVVIPTLNAERRLGECLQALSGDLVREIVVSDGGSVDDTLKIARAAGAIIIAGKAGRGGQLARGAAAASSGWLLFLHGDTILSDGWAGEVEDFINASPERAAVFTLAFDREGWAPGLVARGAMLRTRIFSSPYGDQGLLISRNLYNEIGGYDDRPLFEDVDIMDRIVKTKGRRAVAVLNARAVTSAARYERDGYAARIFKNVTCLAMYRLGVSPDRISAYYRK